MTTELYLPPLEEGARVMTDVIPAEEATPFQAGTHTTDFRAAWDGEIACDLVLVAVPAGEGVSVEAAIRRALQVEAT